MKLSAQVIADSLPESFETRLLGTPKEGLTLQRPELLERGCRELRDNHLYVVTEDRLPHRVSVRPGAVIVSIGPGSRLRYFSERCCVMQVQNADLYSTFNAIQRIFDRYDAWETVLGEIINDDADINTMLECSAPVFDNPLSVIDSQFRYLGRWERDETSDASILAGLGASAILDPNDFERYLSHRDLEMDVAEPFLLELLGTTTLNTNLIDAGEYLGCLTVYYERRPWRKSDNQLADYLSCMIVRAIRRQSQLPEDSSTSLRRILMDLVDEIPLDNMERALLDAPREESPYVCVRIRLGHRLNRLPIGYVCTMVERAFPHSIVFEHHRISVVAFVDIQSLMNEDGSYLPKLVSTLEGLVQPLSAKAGISEPMGDLSRARLYFLQASSTLENGSMANPDRSVYLHQDYALMGMVLNAMGSLPPDMLFSEGLRRLIEHDERSQTSYLQTLSALLDNSMSITKTARALYVHRSTLIERVNRIKRELGEDLDNPDVRLRLQILLKARSLHEELGDRLS